MRTTLSKKEQWSSINACLKPCKHFLASPSRCPISGYPSPGHSCDQAFFCPLYAGHHQLYVLPVFYSHLMQKHSYSLYLVGTYSPVFFGGEASCKHPRHNNNLVKAILPLKRLMTY